MIFLTLGTIDYQFDRAISWLETLIENKKIAEEIWIQHGVTDVARLKKYSFVKSFPMLSRKSMMTICQASRLVISHGGQGSTQSLASQRIAFVLIPRLAVYGEHVDNHQLLFAQSVASFGVKHCLSIEALEEAIRTPPPPIDPLFTEQPKLVDYLVERYPGTKLSANPTHVVRPNKCSTSSSPKSAYRVTSEK